MGVKGEKERKREQNLNPNQLLSTLRLTYSNHKSVVTRFQVSLNKSWSVSEVNRGRGKQGEMRERDDFVGLGR